MERSGQSVSTGWYCIDELQLHVLTTISERGMPHPGGTQLIVLVSAHSCSCWFAAFQPPGLSQAARGADAEPARGFWRVSGEICGVPGGLRGVEARSSWVGRGGWLQR
jgi:hypothetical protein